LLEVIDRLRERFQSGLFFSKTPIIRVAASLKYTRFRVDGFEPASGYGKVPCKIHIWGYLIGTNPDGSEGMLGAKPIRLVVNGISVWEGSTGWLPANPDGWFDLYWDILKEGTYEIYVEFLGDTEWAPCQSFKFVVVITRKATKFRVDGAEPKEGKVPFQFHMWGYLIGVNPDGSEGGLGGKPIKLYMNGAVVWNGTTGGAPSNPDGWFDLYWNIPAEGTYDFYVEFPGDDEWAGC